MDEGKNQTETEFERIKKQINIFNEIGKTLTSSLTINEVLENIFYKVAEFFNPENWSLLLVDEEKNELYFKIVVGPAANETRNIRLKIGEGIAGWVAETGKPLFVPNVREEPRFSKKIEELNPFSTESVICIPLKVRNKVLGVIELINKENISCFNQYDMEILTTVAEYAAIALENAKNYEKVQRLTVTDDITCLYNSRHLHNILHSEVEKAKEARKKFSIIFFDLDAFKLVNDSHGHRIGSSLLGRIGKFISENLKEGYYAARYGGDEFVIILPNTSKNHALEYCRGLLNKLNSEKFFSEEGLNICLTASFGIATFPDDADNKDDILHVADARMYRVKERQKNDIEYS